MQPGVKSAENKLPGGGVTILPLRTTTVHHGLDMDVNSSGTSISPVLVCERCLWWQPREPLTLIWSFHSCPQVPCGESSGPTAGTSSTSSTSGGSAGDAELHRSGSARGSRAGSSSAAASSAQQLHPTPSQGSFSGATGVSSSGGASPAGHLQTASGSAPAPLPEVLQYTKFCHLVPAQGGVRGGKRLVTLHGTVPSSVQCHRSPGALQMCK
jgi:hypothetical protein